MTSSASSEQWRYFEPEIKEALIQVSMDPNSKMDPKTRDTIRVCSLQDILNSVNENVSELNVEPINEQLTTDET